MSGPSEIDDLHARLALFEASNKELAKLNAALVTKVETLEGLVLRLTEELSRNSKNSNKPPSGDTPGGGKLRKNAKGKKRGGQKGHKGSYRELVPPEQVARFAGLHPHGTTPGAGFAAPWDHLICSLMGPPEGDAPVFCRSMGPPDLQPEGTT
ncbi:MAG: DUF6444 domain-containing protein [Polyangiales bacterium]|nr:hypothetical protein [Sandaracinaceae bacterium]